MLRPALLLFLASLPLVGQADHSLRTRSDLTDGWQFRQGTGSGDASSEWLSAKVPGSVHLDLLRNGRIPDPFYRDNEAKLQWIESAPWEYRTELKISSAQRAAKHLELIFDGLDTTATVFINDRPALRADNMFRRWSLDLKPFVHAGQNHMRVEFTPVAQAEQALIAADKPEADLHIPDKAYLRKAAYEFGWDWGPRFVTSGVWKPVHVESWSNLRVDDVYVQQLDVNEAAAHLNVRIRLEAAGNGPADLAVRYGVDADQKTATQHVEVHTGVNELSLPIEILQPKRWYPAGYGAQTRYRFTVSARQAGTLEDERELRTGLRSVTLRREPDQWGRSFDFLVNGIPIFAKGADVIPFDSFPTRVGHEQYKRILGSARDANMNMIRLWGGGYYESDDFYDMCDELGLMVWQDFMYASAWYPGLYDFKQNMEQEAIEQVERLRNHPSLTLWSGNNEVESVLYAFLGGQSEKGRLQIWKNYLTEFSGILPRVVARLNPEVPYWPSSPSADYEETSDTFKSGDAHDWSIWHGREPFSNYNAHYDRFNSEYGFQSFPELRTVESFTNPEDRASIFTPVMLAHQKNNEGNSIIHEYLLRDYAEPKDFASFLYASQVLQAEGVKMGAEHMRRSRPRIMGSLFWQLNDCWPVASWSSIDSFGRWKALQYYARRFYSPLLVSPVIEEGSLKVYTISDQVTPVQAMLRVRRMRLTGEVLNEQTQPVQLPPLASAVSLQRPLSEIAKDHTPLEDQFITADLIVDGKVVSTNLIYLESTKQVSLPPAAIKSSFTEKNGHLTVTLSSPVLARDVYLTFGNLDVELSDNYFDLIPGQTRDIELSGADRQQIEKQLKITSLVDAFPPSTTGSALTGAGNNSK